jgi:hypothetical protein
MSETRSEAIRLAPELDEKVAKIAKAFNRPKSWVIEQACLGEGGTRCGRYPLSARQARSIRWQASRNTSLEVA